MKENCSRGGIESLAAVFRAVDVRAEDVSTSAREDLALATDTASSTDTRNLGTAHTLSSAGTSTTVVDILIGSDTLELRGRASERSGVGDRACDGVGGTRGRRAIGEEFDLRADIRALGLLRGRSGRGTDTLAGGDEGGEDDLRGTSLLEGFDDTVDVFTDTDELGNGLAVLLDTDDFLHGLEEGVTLAGSVGGDDALGEDGDGEDKSEDDVAEHCR